MKICIVSYSHDRAPMLAAAVAAARDAGAEHVVHCGDVIGANTLRPLMQIGVPVHVVHGNNLGDPVALWRLTEESGGLITYCGQDADLRLGGRRIFVTHFPQLCPRTGLHRGLRRGLLRTLARRRRRATGHGHGRYDMAG